MNATATTFNLGDDAGNRQYRGILSFDTSPLPDNAVLDLRHAPVQEGGTGGRQPIPDAWTHPGGRSQRRVWWCIGPGVGRLPGNCEPECCAELRQYPGGGWFSKGSLPPTSATSISLAATQFRLRFANGDNSNLSADYLMLYSGDASAGNRPALIIKYYVP